MVKAGLREIDHVNPNNRKEVKQTHGFRKFYDSGLIKANIHPYLITGFIGHSKKRLEQRYSRLTEDERFTEYQTAIPKLTIDPSVQYQKKIEEQKEQLNEIQLMKLEHKNQMHLLLDENKKTNEGIQMLAEMSKDLAKELYKRPDFPDNKRNDFSIRLLEVADKMGWEIKEKEVQKSPEEKEAMIRDLDKRYEKLVASGELDKNPFDEYRKKLKA